MDRFKSLLHDFWLSPNTTIIIKVTITAPCFKDGDYTVGGRARVKDEGVRRGEWTDEERNERKRRRRRRRGEDT